MNQKMKQWRNQNNEKKANGDENENETENKNEHEPEPEHEQITISYNAYIQNANLIVYHIKKSEESENEGLKQGTIENIMMKEKIEETENANELEKFHKILRFIIHRLIEVDHILLIKKDSNNVEDRILIVHPNYDIDSHNTKNLEVTQNDSQNDSQIRENENQNENQNQTEDNINDISNVIQSMSVDTYQNETNNDNDNNNDDDNDNDKENANNREDENRNKNDKNTKPTKRKQTHKRT